MNRSDYIGVVYRDNEHMRQLHRAYYGQFVTEEVTNLVLRTIGLKSLMDSTDRSFNDIPLYRWDRQVSKLPASVPAQMRQCGDYLTLAGGVCILKEAARQIKERSRGGDCDDHAIGLAAAIMSVGKEGGKDV